MSGKTETADVIVMGGGVAGLAAGRQLARAHFRVVLLEARGRLGGRIDTRRPPGWPEPVELGAQFVHGGNAAFWRLVRQAGLPLRRLRERHWLAREGALVRVRDLGARLARTTGQIDPGRAGRDSFAAYFRRHPPEVSPEDWMLACGFVEGFEAAPMGEISARSLAQETMDEEDQYGLPGGYDGLVAALAADGARHGLQVRLGARVRSVRWRRGEAQVTTGEARGGAGQTYAARAVVVALPLGVLRSQTGTGAVRFSPPLRRQQALARRMGVGHVVRLTFLFRARGWRRLWPQLLQAGRRDGLGFLHSRSPGVPVWWSLSDQPILVGWAGGPAASALLRLSPGARRRRAVRSLAELLQLAPLELQKQIVDCQTHDWTRDPFSRGAYSFIRAGADGAAKQLRRPVQGTIFFAGEATADGSEVGTVHGALGSGLRAAAEIRARARARPRKAAARRKKSRA